MNENLNLCEDTSNEKEAAMPMNTAEEKEKIKKVMWAQVETLQTLVQSYEWVPCKEDIDSLCKLTSAIVSICNNIISI